MKYLTQGYIKGCAALLVVLTFSGCDFFRKKEVVEPKADSKVAGAALCTINGDITITEGDFVNNLNQMIQSNPYFRGATAESLPKDIQHKFFEQLVTQSLIEKQAIKNNVEKDAEFIKAYNETKKLVKRHLMVQFYEKKLFDGIEVSEADITKHYNENKDRFVKVAGGVLAMGARFETDALATAFMNKAKINPDNFEKMAKDEKSAKFRDFGRVGKEQPRGFQFEVVPGPIKESVLSMTKLPGLEKIKVGKEFWVVKAWDKKDTVLFELSDVKSHIEAMLKSNKFKDVIDENVKKLKQEFKVVTNEDYFKDAAKEDGKEASAEQAEPKAATAA